MSLYLYIGPILLIVLVASEFLPLIARKASLFACLQILGVISALDANIVDFQEYARHYDNNPTLAELLVGEKSLRNGYGEYGYVAMSAVSKSVGLNYEGFRLGFFIISMVLVYIFLVKTCTNFVLPVLWYFCFHYYGEGNVLRTTMAAHFAWLAFYYYVQRSFSLFCVMAVAAVSFHLIALLIVIPVVLWRIDPGQRVAWGMVFLSLLIAVLVPLEQLVHWWATGPGDGFFIGQKLGRYLETRQSEDVFRAIALVSVLTLLLASSQRAFMKDAAVYPWSIFIVSAICSLWVFRDIDLVANRAFAIFGIAGGIILAQGVRLFTFESRVAYVAACMSFLVAFSSFKHAAYFWQTVEMRVEGGLLYEFR